MLYLDILRKPFTVISACKTHYNIHVYKTVFLKMNPRNSKHAEDIKGDDDDDDDDDNNSNNNNNKQKLSLSYFRRVRKTVKHDYSFVMSVCPSAWNYSAPPDGFSRNLLFEDNQMCRANTIFITSDKNNWCFT